jgi:DNA adenine methylase
LNSAARSQGGRLADLTSHVISPVLPTPFLKWAGGKSRLLSTFANYFPRQFDGQRHRYFEPFIGGGAVFFHLLPERAVISDLNPELINCYQVVRDDVDRLVARLRRHKNDQDHYYRVRAQDTAKLTPVERAARLIFLNKTCFNGLYRVNSKGQFNVPFGRYENPKICDATNLHAVSTALAKVDITCNHFEAVLERARKGDFIYLDPPYQPISATANFTGYTATSFGNEDQTRLSEVVRTLSRRGCLIMLSNSNSDLVRELYDGFRIETVYTSRAINCRPDKRGRIAELLVMNY